MDTLAQAVGKSLIEAGADRDLTEEEQILGDLRILAAFGLVDHVLDDLYKGGLAPYGLVQSAQESGEEPVFCDRGQEAGFLRGVQCMLTGISTFASQYAQEHDELQDDVERRMRERGMIAEVEDVETQA